MLVKAVHSIVYSNNLGIVELESPLVSRNLELDMALAELLLTECHLSFQNHEASLMQEQNQFIGSQLCKLEASSIAADAA